MDELQQALAEMGWSLIEQERVVGGFTGTLYRLRLRDQVGAEVRAVYKRFAEGRDAERTFYQQVVPLLAHGVPRLYRIVAEKGLLIEDAGKSVKSIFRSGDAASQKEILAGIVALFAELHASLEQVSDAWRQDGLVSPYPFHSSIDFANEALVELDEQLGKLDGVDRALLAELREIASFFYPRYQRYVEGRQTFTHGDPHMENILHDGRQFRLIDWEYSSLAVPVRDVTILLQDVLDQSLHPFVLDLYRSEMEIRGWVFEADFDDAYTACMLDNTLMMLGFELWKYRQGHLKKAEIETILAIKCGWIRQCARKLKREC